MTTTDFTVTNHGSLFTLLPNTPEAEDWVADHIPDDAQYLGRAVAVEHRYIAAIVDGIQGDGLTVD